MERRLWHETVVLLSFFLAVGQEKIEISIDYSSFRKAYDKEILATYTQHSKFSASRILNRDFRLHPFFFYMVTGRR